MTEVRFAKTANRSVLGVMNQFARLAEGYRAYLETDDLLVLSLKLAGTPCSPLYQGNITPERELKAVVGALHLGLASRCEGKQEGEEINCAAQRHGDFVLVKPSIGTNPQTVS